VQRHRRELSNRLLDSGYSTFGADWDRPKPHADFEPDGNDWLHIELHDYAAYVSDELFPATACTIMTFWPRLRLRTALAQGGDGVDDGLQRLLGGVFPGRNGLRSTMKIEPADVADMRRDVDVRRVAGESHAR